MKYSRFDDTPVWQAAIQLAHRVFDLLEDRLFDGTGDLRNQLQRAALSISNNIAEGFERGTNNELISFLYIARGSAGEVRSSLRFAGGRSKLEPLQTRIDEVILDAESVSRQLFGWANSLQNSDMKGLRSVNDRVRAETEQQTRAAALWEKLQAVRDRAIANQSQGNQQDPQNDDSRTSS